MFLRQQQHRRGLFSVRSCLSCLRSTAPCNIPWAFDLLNPFKPSWCYLQEPLARNNPRGRGSSGGDESVRKGVLPGEGAVREVAAFVLDHQHFAGVPPTALVSCQQVGPLASAEVFMLVCVC